MTVNSPNPGPVDDPIAKANAALRLANRMTTHSAAPANTQQIPVARNSDIYKPRATSLKGFAENVGVIADAIRMATAAFGWIREKAREIAEYPYVGPILTTPFKVLYRGYYNFIHPYPNESLLKATSNTLTYPIRKTFNALGNMVGQEPVPLATKVRERGPISRKRAGIAAVTTLWALTGLFKVPVAGDSFNYFVLEPMIDSARISATLVFNGVTGHGFGLTRDTLHYGVPTKESGDDIYHVTASEHRSGDESNSLSFVMRDRLMNQLWSVANGHGPYRPDYVVAPIRPDANECETISYGSRLRLARWLSFKPDVLSLSCHPPISTPAPAPAAPANN